MPLIAFAPSMILSDLAKASGFDPSFPIAEDVDFLLRALSDKRYAVLPDPLYVYCEPGSVTLTKVSSALDHCCRMFGKHFEQHPVESAIEITKARAKQLIYYSASAVGLWNYMIARRSRIPSKTDFQQYHHAKQIVSEIASAYALAV
jgi:hypothetical protein